MFIESLLPHFLLGRGSCPLLCAFYLYLCPLPCVSLITCLYLLLEGVIFADKKHVYSISSAAGTTPATWPVSISFYRLKLLRTCLPSDLPLGHLSVLAHSLQSSFGEWGGVVGLGDLDFRPCFLYLFSAFPLGLSFFMYNNCLLPVPPSTVGQLLGGHSYSVTT